MSAVFRYERKFLTDQLDERQVRALVGRHPALFFQPYPPRYVNNLYLDGAALENYWDNVGGAADRQKVRIRWYGELHGRIDRPVLEFKIKRGLVGTKELYPLPGFDFGAGFRPDVWPELLAGAELPPHLRPYLRRLEIVLCNRYARRYYATRDHRFRLTIDSELCYYQVRPAGTTFRRRFNDYRNVVVELKYAPELDRPAERVAGFFPFTVTRNSKYVTGIERVYL